MKDPYYVKPSSDSDFSAEFYRSSQASTFEQAQADGSVHRTATFHGAFAATDAFLSLNTLANAIEANSHRHDIHCRLKIDGQTYTEIPIAEVPSQIIGISDGTFNLTPILNHGLCTVFACTDGRTIITTTRQSEVIQWTYGDYSGTVTLPSGDRERYPTVFEWNEDAPENWEEIEDKILSSHAKGQAQTNP